MHYEIGPFIFKKKRDIREHADAVRRKWTLGLSVDAGEIAFLLDLFPHHPHYEAKLQGATVVRLYLGICDVEHGEPNRTFRLKLSDGRDVEISYKKACRGVPGIYGMRELREILARRQHVAELEKVAARSVRSLAREVEEAPPAEQLFRLFLGDRDPTEVKIKKRPGVSILAFEDPGFAAAWVAFYSDQLPKKVA